MSTLVTVPALAKAVPARGDRGWTLFVLSLEGCGAAMLAGLVADFVWLSWRWPVVNDAALMHYVVFLLRHGWVPYRHIRDINLPGAYLPDWLATHVGEMGLGVDRAWRLYDLGLLAVAAAAMVAVARRRDWFAGVFAGALLALFHGRDGIGQTGQRDLAMAVLFLVAAACLLACLRTAVKRRWLLACSFGLALGAATTIKPFGAVLFVVFAAVAGLWLRADGQSVRKLGVAALAGFALPLAAMTAWLLREHAMVAFLTMCRVSLPYHAEAARPPFWRLVQAAWPGSLLKLGALSLAIMLVRKSWRLRQTQVVLLGIGCGLFCFFAQHKGYGYQRYPYAGFWLLWVGLECTAALRARGAVLRGLGIATLLVGVCGCATSYLRVAARSTWQEPYLQALARDLQAAGGTSLDGRVQCVDTISGCVNVLYRMGLQPATGMLYDEFLFPSPAAGAWPALLASRQVFWAELAAQPPQVFVVASWLFPEGPGDYRKLGEWRAFEGYLEQSYRLVDAEEFGWSQNGPLGFRVYVHR